MLTFIYSNENKQDFNAGRRGLNKCYSLMADYDECMLVALEKHRKRLLGQQKIQAQLN